MTEGYKAITAIEVSQSDWRQVMNHAEALRHIMEKHIDTKVWTFLDHFESVEINGVKLIRKER